MELTTEQRAAIEAYARRYGPDWKESLSADWQSGRDVNALRHDGIDGCYLRQIRNQFGPAWLATFTLDGKPAAPKTPWKTVNKALAALPGLEIVEISDERSIGNPCFV